MQLTIVPLWEKTVHRSAPSGEGGRLLKQHRPTKKVDNCCRCPCNFYWLLWEWRAGWRTKTTWQRRTGFCGPIEDTQVTLVTSGRQLKKKKKSTKRLHKGAECAMCALAGEEATYILLLLGKWFERFGAGAWECGSQVAKMAAISWGLHLGSCVLLQKPKLKGHRRI